MDPIRIGTRKSPLAVAQARWVAERLAELHAPLRVELAPISTRGDLTPGRLADAGGKGLFTAELEACLRDRSIHLAVHSAKDLPAEMDPAFVIAAVPPREDPRDALVSATGPIEALPRGARVGTGSPRRAALLRCIRPDVQIVPIRGNVDTRLRNALSGELDGVVLAMAGLRRSGLADANAEAIHPLPIEQVVPAAGQACLAVQCPASDTTLRSALAALHDEQSGRALEAERAVCRAMQADCHSCLAVHFHQASQGVWQGLAMSAQPDGSQMIRAEKIDTDLQAVLAALLTLLRPAK